MRCEKGDYVLYLLGKNGEPKPKVNVKMNIAHSHLLDSSVDKEFSLKTDSEGKIKLGKLRYVMGVFVRVPLYNIDQPFMIN